MKHLVLLAFLFLISCGQKQTNESSVQPTGDSLVRETISDTLVSNTTNTSETVVPDDSLQVTAFLVYENGDLSSFDILNDEGIALWNTIIGEGSAEASSQQTKIIISGNEKAVDILIKNGDDVSIDQKAVDIHGELEFIVKDTGCSLVEITLSQKDKTRYQRSIPFECGE